MMAQHIRNEILRVFLLLLFLIGALGCDSGVSEPSASLPAVPTMLSPSNAAPNQANAVALQWNPSNGATSYHVQVAATPNFSDNEVDEEWLLPTSLDVNSLAIGTTYYWHVRARNDVGFSDWSATWHFTPTYEAVLPGLSTLKFPADGAIGQPTTIWFEWEPSSGARTYQIQVAVEPDFLRRSADLEGVADTKQWVKGLIHSYTYYWRIRARNPAGYGPWSPTWRFVVEDG